MKSTNVSSETIQQYIGRIVTRALRQSPMVEIDSRTLKPLPGQLPQVYLTAPTESARRRLNGLLARAGRGELPELLEFIKLLDRCTAVA